LGSNKTSTYYFRLSAAALGDYAAATSSVTTSNSTTNTRTVQITALDGSNNQLSNVINPGDQWFIFARVLDESGNKIVQRADIYDKIYGSTETVKTVNNQDGSAWFLGGYSSLSTDPYTSVQVGTTYSTNQSHRIKFSYPALDGYSAAEGSYTLYVKETYTASSSNTKVIKTDGSMYTPQAPTASSQYLYQGPGFNDNLRTLISFNNPTGLQRATSSRAILSGTLSFYVPNTSITATTDTPSWTPVNNSGTLYISVLNSSAINASNQFISGYNDDIGSVPIQSISISRSASSSSVTYNLNPDKILNKFLDPQNPGKGILIGYKDTIGYNGQITAPSNFLWLYGYTPGNINSNRVNLSLTYYMDPSQ